MTFQQAVEYATTRLSPIIDNARFDARLLVCLASDSDLTKLLTHPTKQLTNEELTAFKSFLTRRGRGEPLAYLVGEKEFWSLTFIVNQHVLIPRPDTEVLVEIALRVIAEKQTPRILELGTGSAAIAVALAKERDDATVTATDISAPALKIAKQNAARHQVSIRFICSDWYQNLSAEKFDAIVCNPPYVAPEDSHLHPHVTRHEPTEAVISNHNGLQNLKLIITDAHRHLHVHGSLLVEHGFKQAAQVRKLFNQCGFKHVRTHPDLSGRDRVTSGHLYPQRKSLHLDDTG